MKRGKYMQWGPPILPFDPESPEGARRWWESEILGCGEDIESLRTPMRNASGVIFSLKWLVDCFIPVRKRPSYRRLAVKIGDWRLELLRSYRREFSDIESRARKLVLDVMKCLRAYRTRDKPDLIELHAIGAMADRADLLVMCLKYFEQYSQGIRHIDILLPLCHTEIESLLEEEGPDD